MDFPNPPSKSTRSTKKTNPDSFRSLPASYCCHGSITHSLLPEDHPHDRGPSTTSSISRTLKGPASLDQIMFPNASHYWPCTGGTNTRNPGHGNVHVKTAAPLQKRRRAPPLAAQLASCSRTRRKSQRGFQTGNEPGTDAASEWQWREFYYYPIITLGSVPKWSMLPPWCHFLLSWLETKSGSMGAIHMMSLHFTATASLSFSLSEIHRKINSSQKWLKNA